MSHSAQLLRLLEPAVRPVAQPSSVAPAGSAPFDSADFEGLLDDARRGLDGLSDAVQTESNIESAKPSPLAELGSLSRIENQSLRDILARHSTMTDTTPATTAS